MKLSKSAQIIFQFIKQTPNKKCHVNEIIRETKIFPRSATLALKKLESLNLIKIKQIGNIKLISANLKTIKKVRLNYKKPLNKNKKINWIKILTRKTDLCFQTELATGCQKYFKTYLEKDVLYNFNWFNSITGSVYVVPEEFEKQSQIVVENVEKDPKFAAYISKVTKIRSDELVVLSKILSVKINKNDELTYQELKEFLIDFQNVYQRFLPLIVLGTSIEYRLIDKIKEHLKSIKQEKLFQDLVSPYILLTDERNSALKIAIKIQNNVSYKKIDQDLKKHAENFSYLSMELLSNQPYKIDYFRKEIEELALTSTKVKKYKQKSIFSKAIRAIKNSIILEIINLLQEFIYLRTYRINSLYQANYFIQSLFCKIQNKLGLSDNDIFYLTINEIKDLLNSKSVDRKDVEKINLRKKAWAALLYKGKSIIFSGYEQIIKAIEYFDIKSDKLNKDERSFFMGMVASRGQVTGKVKIIKNATQLGKLDKGDILVTTMTTPDFVVGMSRAAAIITDEGGITCHAAIVSRELNVPCIVGTKIATKALSDNDIVFVDAILGKITILEKQVIFKKKILSGKPIFPGIIKGKINDKDILVCQSVTPTMLSIIYRIKGLIVEEESYTSHAYLFSQAFNIPAIMGVKNATQLLQQNQKITLDAKNGFIYL